MALTIKQLSLKSSFLLTFEPLGGNVWEPFRILLDPVLSEPQDILHSNSPSTLCGQHVSSLKDMFEPDVVIISQNKHGHLHEATLKQLPPRGTKTIILAEPAAAKAVKSWKYFDEGIVRKLSTWEEPRGRANQVVTRLPVPPCYLGGDEGEVTVSMIRQKKDPKGIHSAIGITYRPPPSRPSIFRRPIQTPPVTPTSAAFATPQLPPLKMDTATTPLTARIVPPTPPDTPILSQPLQKVRHMSALTPHASDRILSVIFSPYGTAYSSLEPYATSHMVSEAALPLTALIQSFSGEKTPWWSISQTGTGKLVGQDTVLKLGARCWIGAHCEGQAAANGRRPRRRKLYTTHEVRDMLNLAEGKEHKPLRRSQKSKATKVLDLSHGEEVILTSEDVWESGIMPQPKDIVPDALGLFNNLPLWE